MNWSAICPVLIALFTELALDQVEADPIDPQKFPRWSAEWSEQHRGMMAPGVRQALYLKVTSVVPVGEDETRYSAGPLDDDGAPTLLSTVTGLRRFVLQVQSVVTERNIADGLWCMQTLERIRTRLSRRSSIERLLAVDVALVRTEQSVKTARPKGQHQQSVGVMDVVLTAAVNDADPVPVGWIQGIELTMDVRNPAAGDDPDAWLEQIDVDSELGGEV